MPRSNRNAVMCERVIAIVAVFFLALFFVSCSKKGKESPAGTAKGPQPIESPAQDLFFPPEEKPMRTEEVDLSTLLEEYITPHLKILPLREKDKESLPPNTIAIRFNYPMVAKENIGIPSRQGIWSFIPYRAGTYLWKDESILTFQPNRPWDSDAEVTGLLPTGVTSINGYRLLEPYQASVDFTGGIEIAGKLISTEDITPGEPKIIGIDPPVGETLGDVPGVVLIFDQPVLVDYVRGKVEMAVKGKGESDFRVVPHALLHAKGTMIKGIKVADAYTVLVKPAMALPSQSDVKLIFAAGLKEADAYEASFSTPMPLLIEAISCQQWTACRVDEEPGASNQQRISIADATGYLKLQFNDTLEAAMGKEVAIVPPPKQQKAEVVDKILYLSWDWQPNMNYTIRFTDRFRNRYGFKLAKAVTIALRTGQLLPAVEAPIGLKAIDRGKATALRLKWRNLSSLRIRQYPVTGDGLASSLQFYFERPGESFFPSPSKEKPTLISFSGDPEANAWQEARVPTVQLLGRGGANVFFLQYETDPFVPQTPETAKRLSALVQVTDVGLTAKRLAGGLSIGASSMTTGAPQGGVSVTVLQPDGSVVAEGKTDENGALFIASESATDLLKAPLVLAERGGPAGETSGGEEEGEGEEGEGLVEDMTASMSEEGEGEMASIGTTASSTLLDEAYLWIGDKRISADFFELPRPMTSTIDAVLKGEGQARGFVFTDKGVYRGGQALHVKGYVALPPDADDEKVEFALHTPNSTDAIMKETVPLDERRSFQFDGKIDPQAAPGRYHLEASTEGGGTVATAEILIADSTNATFKLDLINPKKGLTAGEPWQVEIRPEYFFGLPVALGSLEYSVYTSPIKFAPPGYEGYDFYDRYAENSFDSWNESVSNQKIPLSASGMNRLSLSTREDWWDERFSSPVRFYLSATVNDISGETMTADAEVVTYPSDAYIGLRDRYEYAKDRPIVFEWVALSSLEAAPMSGVEASAELYRLEEHWYQEEGVEEDSYYTESETLRDLVATCTTRSSPGREGCSLGTQPPGRYALRLMSKRPGGAMVVASEEIVVAGGGAMPVAESKKHLLKPTMDRESYRPGETGYVLFENPYPRGYATVTVENGTILDRKVVATEEGMMKVPVKIQEAYAPNAFVGVHLSIGRRGQTEDGLGNDVSGPTYLVGYAPLKVDLALQRLNMALSADKAQYRPGDEVRLDLAVTDGAGKPVEGGEVTLYAVDESTLELTKYKTPEPILAMYPEQPLAVEIADNRTKAYSTDYLLSVIEKGQVGGDGGMEFDDFAKKRVRKEFPDTLFWKPDLTTNAGGKVNARFKLADAAGSVRAMAVAHKEGKLFGSAWLSLRVAMPLSADPILPAFLIRGDKSEVRVRIHNTMHEPQTVSVHLAAPRQETKEVRVERSGTALATFELEAPSEGQEMIVEVALRAKNFSDAIKKRIPIHENFAQKTREISGAFSADQVLHLKKPESWAGVDAVHLRFSSVPIPDLAHTLYDVLSYPYASLSTLVSAISAVGTIRDRFEDFLPKDFLSEKVLDDHIAARIRLLPAYQLSGGGLANWPKDVHEDLLETANALFVLSQIEFDHDDTIYDALKKRVQEIAKRGVDGVSSDADQKVAALSLAALAFAGAEDGALGTQLAAARQKLNPYALAMTAVGLSRMGRSAEVAELLPLLSDKLKAPLAAGDRAAGLMGLLACDPKSTMAVPILQSLFADRDAFANPALAAASLMALATYHERAKKASAPKLELILDGRPVKGDALRKENALQVAIDLPFVENHLLRMTSTNKKAVYFNTAATFRDMFTVDPQARVSRGIHLFSTIEDTEGKEVEGERLTLGELYHIRIYAKADEAIDGFFLDVALPAGLAPQNIFGPLSVEPPETSGGTEGPEGEGDGGDRRYLLTEKARRALTHTEYHSDRVRFFADDLPAGLYCFDFYARATNGGEFLMPPADSGSLADPDVWARLPARRVAVED